MSTLLGTQRGADAADAAAATCRRDQGSTNKSTTGGGHLAIADEAGADAGCAAATLPTSITPTSIPKPDRRHKVARV